MSIKMLMASMLLCSCVYVDAREIELTSGVRQEFGMTYTDGQRAALPVVTKVVKAAQSSGRLGLSEAFLNIAATDVWCRLYENMHVYAVDVSQERLLSDWLLSRWSHQYFSPDVKNQFVEMYMDYPLPFSYESVVRGPGCLGDSPLRYGDFEDDGHNEAVVILGGLFVVLSPEYGRMVFSEYLDESDWYTAEEMEEFLAGQSYPVGAQYISRLWADNSNRRGPGVRAYAKLYFGDFDKDGNRDIVAWRKSYRSNAIDNPTKGFTKLRDSWGHFERDLEAQEDTDQGITGEYLPQDTDEETIRQWLAESDLTWKNGFPSTSECKGEQDKPIPEMHDPLLNDPEVLQ